MSRRGGILNDKETTGNRRSALICLFKYLETASPNAAVDQCLTTIVYRAFGAALTWLVCFQSLFSDRKSALDCGNVAKR